MFQGKRQTCKPFPKEKVIYKKCPSIDEEQLTEACNLNKDPILPKGDLWAEFVSVPENIPFTEALEKVRQCMQNIQFYVTDLNNKLVFLHESFSTLDSIRPQGTDKAFVCSPKTPQEIEILLRDNKDTLESISGQSVNILFPQKKQFKSAPYHQKSQIKPKQKFRRHSNNNYSSESVHSSVSEPIFPKTKVQKNTQNCKKGTQKCPSKPKRYQDHKKVRKVSSCEYPKGDNFEQFVQKVVATLNDTKITK